MDDLPSLMPLPNPIQPLLGLTVLVVEDSLYACDAVRLMCLHSGARIRRADCLSSARRHLKMYRPSVMIIDLGLPDGTGADLIAELSRSTPRVMSILGTSGSEGAEARCRAAGADGFIAKPIANLDNFQQTILTTLPSDRRPTGPRLVNDTKLCPDPLAYRDDMLHASNLLDQHSDGPQLEYVVQFLSGVARSVDDQQLALAADALTIRRRSGMALNVQLARLASLVQDRLASQVAI